MADEHVKGTEGGMSAGERAAMEGERSALPRPHFGDNVPGAGGVEGGVRPPREYPMLPAMAAIKTPYFHIIGYSVAGEESVVQVPELNLNFDIGKCPRPALTADY